MPRRVDAASRCSAFCHAAISRPVGAAPSRLKCVIRFVSRNSLADGVAKTGFGSSRSPIAIIVWKKSPAFSSIVIASRRSCTRSSTGRSAFSQGRAVVVAVVSEMVT